MKGDLFASIQTRTSYGSVNPAAPRSPALLLVRARGPIRDDHLGGQLHVLQERGTITLLRNRLSPDVHAVAQKQLITVNARLRSLLKESAPVFNWAISHSSFAPRARCPSLGCAGKNASRPCHGPDASAQAKAQVSSRERAMNRRLRTVTTGVPDGAPGTDSCVASFSGWR
jgi:hypothetical protein